MTGEPQQPIDIEDLEKLKDSVPDLTIEEGLQLAISRQRQGDLELPEKIYRRVLELDPNNATALHFLGLLAMQTGHIDDAISLIARSLEEDPTTADWHSNYALALRRQGRHKDAIAACERALAINPQHANARNNLGILFTAVDQLDDAEAAFRQAIADNPKHVDAHINLGLVLKGRGELKEAVQHFCRVVTLGPSEPNPTARRLLGLSYCMLGEVDKATEIYEEWLREEPGDPVAEHMLAACRGGAVPDRASDSFVTRSFDGYAATFEESLARLSYRAPILVDAMVQTAVPVPAQDLVVLDAGCGTGLCGPYLAPYARHLIGVDLSGGMLTQAKAKGIYDELGQVELTEYLKTQENRFDLIVSADTLVYFGDLQEVIRAAAAALRPGGHLIFTVEHGEGENVPDVRLSPNGRYTHSQPYIERTLTASGLELYVRSADLRLEGGLPVPGLTVRATKPAVS